MHTAPSVHFHGFTPGPDLPQEIHERIKHLDRLSDRVTGINVTMALPHRHQRSGRIFHVHIRVGIPGGELVVDRENEKDDRHSDPLVAVHDAFSRMERQLNDWVNRQRETRRHGHA